MRRRGARLAAILGVACGLMGAGPRPPSGQQQVAIDEVLRHFDGVVITNLDVRMVRLLDLFPDATTDAARLRALENRHLMLGQVALFPPDEPDPSAIAARRAAWAARLGAGPDLADLLARAGMTEAALAAWFRDDLRIESYLALRFGAMPADTRPAMIESWIEDMRRRAGLR